jgi:hypothetical protein
LGGCYSRERRELNGSVDQRLLIQVGMALVQFSDFVAGISTMTPQNLGPPERACLKRLLDPYQSDFVTPHQFEALLKPCGPLTDMPLKVSKN